MAKPIRGRPASLIGRLSLISSLCLILSPCMTALAQRRLTANAVREVRVTRDGGTLRATIELDGYAPYSHFTLPSPTRVVVDIKGVRQALRPDLPPGEHVIIDVG